MKVLALNSSARTEYMVRAGKMRNDILEATKSAGHELVKFRKVSPETLSRISQPISNNVTEFAEVANCMWHTCIAERDMDLFLNISKFFGRND